MSGAVLVQFSNLDLGTLLPLARKVLDRSLSSPGDSVGCEPPLHHMLCVGAIRDPDIRPTAEACRPYLNLYHAGFVIVADERDLAEIFELAGMPCVMVESVRRGTCMAFISGTLTQWQTATLRGCQKTVGHEARVVYNKVYNEFNKVGLASIFDADSKHNDSDQTFYLEYRK